MTKIKGWMFALMGAMLMATSCSDTEFKNGNEDAGTAAPKNSSALVSVYSDKSGSEASLLVGDVLVAMVIPAEGPSFGVAPSGTWMWIFLARSAAC